MILIIVPQAVQQNTQRAGSRIQSITRNTWIIV